MRHLPLAVVGLEVPEDEASSHRQGKPTVVYLSFAPSAHWKQAFDAYVDATGGKLAAARPLVVGNRVIASPCFRQAAGVASQLRAVIEDFRCLQLHL